jgi:hypothetical protein
MSLTRDILQKVSGYGRDVGNEKENALGPLWRAMGKVVGLNEAISKGKTALEEEGLCDLGPKLGAARKELMSLGRVLIMSQGLSLADGPCLTESTWSTPGSGVQEGVQIPVSWISDKFESAGVNQWPTVQLSIATEFSVL